MSGGAKKVVKVDQERQPYRTELTPVTFLRRSAYVFPDRTAVVHGARRYTYRQFEERANRLASALRGRGLRQLDRVAFLCPNIPAMLEAHFGVPAGGRRPGADQHAAQRRRDRLHPRSTPARRFLFVDAEFEPLVEAARPAGHPRRAHRRHRRARRSLRGLPRPPARPEPCEPWLEDEDETISINYTSGTTGRPRASCTPPRRLPERHRRGRSRPGMTFDAEYLWTLPMFHCNGWCFTWGVTAVGGHPRLPAPGRARAGSGT